MLRVITGRFHPSLESALVDQLHQAKVREPFAPLAILVPSKPILDRLKRLLTVERQCSFLNVHVLTFHQFALRLADEILGQDRATRIRVVDDLFFEQLVRYIVRSRLSGLDSLQHIGHASGAWAALWSTVRDLKDAGVVPSEAMRGLREGYFDQEDTDRLHAVFSLYAAVKEAGNTLDVGTADDLAESLLPFVPSARLIESLSQVFYYGFYDLTQVQLSFFEAVSAAAPTTLFFPLEEDASYRFARRFFDRHIQPLVTKADALVRLPAPSSAIGPRPATVSLSSVIGPEEELASACRTILDLVETNGYRFEDIGVVARTLDPYGSILQGVFDRHCIPVVTTAGRPLMHEPLCKTLLQLASLPIADFYRVPMLDLISSPLYRAAVKSETSASYRPEQWKMVVAALRITHGRQEWERLKRAGQSVCMDGEDTDAIERLPVQIAPDVTALCWQVVEGLLTACEALPTSGTVGQLVDACQQLAFHHLRRPEADGAEDEDAQGLRLRSAWEEIERTWATLRALDTLGEELSWANFVELLTHALERASVPIHHGTHHGVMVLDAMAARGLPFKALFVLGLNEKVFPRYIREDPFLRDRHRLALDTTLGFKIDEKLGGYDEEALLFALLGHAATHRLYLSFQRADDNGRMAAGSPYIADYARRVNQPDGLVETVPRRLTERVARRPTLRSFLPPAELARWMAMQGQDPTALLQAVGQHTDLFSHAVAALEHIEQESSSLTVFDGVTGHPATHWTKLSQRGIAPTPLERYARCPFQYFLADVLRLDPVRGTVSPAPDAMLLGTLCHASLRRCYESLIRVGWPAVPVTEAAIQQSVIDAVSQAAADCDVQSVTGPYLLWELAKEQIAAVVMAAVAEDRVAQASEPYRPIAFETEADGLITLDIGEQTLPVKIHGRVDRIDRHRDSGALRIIDYKYKTSSAMQAEDRNLVQSAVRGKRLQPPLYARLNFSELGSIGEVQFVLLGPSWPTPVVRSTFVTGVWSSESGTLFNRTLHTILTGIRDGRFFILPDTQSCQVCDYRVACRREHQPTWWRSYRAAESKGLRALRMMRVKDE